MNSGTLPAPFTLGVLHPSLAGLPPSNVASIGIVTPEDAPGVKDIE
jgi:hypothetical protein